MGLNIYFKSFQKIYPYANAAVMVDNGDGLYDLQYFNRTVNLCRLLSDSKYEPFLQLVVRTTLPASNFPRKCPIGNVNFVFSPLLWETYRQTHSHRNFFLSKIWNRIPKIFHLCCRTRNSIFQFSCCRKTVRSWSPCSCTNCILKWRINKFLYKAIESFFALHTGFFQGPNF